MSAENALGANPDTRLCDFYLARKKRFCRMEKNEGNSFCGTHSIEVPVAYPVVSAGDETSSLTLSRENHSAQLRVPCPINPNHTVYAFRLDHHVKVCPDLRFIPNKLSFYKENAHAFRGRSYCLNSAALSSRVTHRDLDASSLQSLIARVRACYNNHIRPGIALISEEEVMPISAADTDIQQETHKVSAKHGPQHRALLRCVEKAVDYFYNGNASAASPIAGFLELAAGKGGLSVALQNALTVQTEERSSATWLQRYVTQDPSLVVVDVDSFRRRGDARVSHTSTPITRLRLNIKDLDLGKAMCNPSVRKRPRVDSSNAADGSLPVMERWVAFGKHLCGACADFAISCITDPTLEQGGKLSVAVVVLATCCHQRCELQHLNALNDVRGGNGSLQLCLPGTDDALTEMEFAAIASMSSWAVSGDFVDEDRRGVGICCKRIIDTWRLEYLLRHGFSSGYICQYTERSITEENICIVAYR